MNGNLEKITNAVTGLCYDLETLQVNLDDAISQIDSLTRTLAVCKRRLIVEREKRKKAIDLI